MFDPLTAGMLIAGWMAFRKQTAAQFGQVTPEREEVYLNAMEHLRDPLKLKAMAEAFEKEGLKLQGKMLRKRGEWRARNTTQRVAHEEVFQKAMQSDNPSAIIQVARAFEGMTATVKARKLYERANALREAQIPTRGRMAQPTQPAVQAEAVGDVEPEVETVAPVVQPKTTNGKGKHVVTVEAAPVIESTPEA